MAKKKKTVEEHIKVFCILVEIGIITQISLPHISCSAHTPP